MKNNNHIEMSCRGAKFACKGFVVSGFVSSWGFWGLLCCTMLGLAFPVHAFNIAHWPTLTVPSDPNTSFALGIRQHEVYSGAELTKVKAKTQVPQGSKSLSGNSDSGKTAFGKYCANCHGPTGNGDGPIGQALVPPAANLTILSKKSDQEILDSIRMGRPGTAMPSWKNDLSPQEIHDVLAYIRTLAL